jgi:glutamyl-tRNA reductase
MQALLSTNWEKRQQAAEYAHQLISHYTGYCFGQLRALQAGGTIKNYRQQINALKEQELEQALHMIDQGKPPKEVLNQFAHRVTQKILHTPSRRMRQAAHAGEHDYLQYAKQILDIDD